MEINLYSKGLNWIKHKVSERIKQKEKNLCKDEQTFKAILRFIKFNISDYFFTSKYNITKFKYLKDFLKNLFAWKLKILIIRRKLNQN